MDEQIQASVVDPIQRLLNRMNVESVFGSPTHVGDVTIIPVAEVQARFGYGVGSGMPNRDDPKQPRAGAGAGGGAMGTARPLGYIRVASDGVQFEPLVDPIRIPLAGILLAGWVVYWVTRTIRAFTR